MGVEGLESGECLDGGRRVEFPVSSEESKLQVSKEHVLMGCLGVSKKHGRETGRGFVNS